MSINTVNILGGTPTSSAAPNSFTTADVLAALQAPAPQMLQQQVQPAAELTHPSMITAPSNPNEAYGQALMQQALSGKPVGSTMEGLGRMAQLVGGYYFQNKGKDAAGEFENKRAAAVHAQLNSIDPSLADAYATADAAGRKDIENSARKMVFDRAGEARQRAEASARAEKIGGAKTAEELEGMMIADPALQGQGIAAREKRLSKQSEPKWRLKSAASDVFPGASAVWERSDGALVSVPVPANGVALPPSDDAAATPPAAAQAATASPVGGDVSAHIRQRATRISPSFAPALTAVADAIDDGDVSIGSLDPARYAGLTGAEMRERVKNEGKSDLAVTTTLRQKAKAATGSLEKMVEAQKLIDSAEAPPAQGFAGQVEAYARTYTTNLFGTDPEMAKRSIFEQWVSGPATLAARGDKESGAFLSGATSDRDLAFMRAMAPNLGGSRIATSAGLEVTVNMARRDLAHQELALMFKSKGRTLGGEDFATAAEAINARISLLSETTKALMSASPRVVEAYQVGGRAAAEEALKGEAAGGGRGTPAQPAEPTATMPDGTKLIVRDGQWVPLTQPPRSAPLTPPTAAPSDLYGID